jgi:hypothetical protein
MRLAAADAGRRLYRQSSGRQVKNSNLSEGRPALPARID